MTVRVVVRQAVRRGYAEEDFVRVRTDPDPNDDTMSLATIQRVTNRSEPDRSEIAPRVKTLLLRQRMPTQAALSLATRYAERKKIFVVYAEESAEAQ